MYRLAMVLKRLVWIVALVLVIALAVGVALVGVVTMRGFPATSGVLSVAGLDDDVRVTRDGARIVQTTGQSGNPFDRHYGDLIDDWLIGETVPLPFTREAVREATIETLQLVPRSGE